MLLTFIHLKGQGASELRPFSSNDIINNNHHSIIGQSIR